MTRNTINPKGSLLPKLLAAFWQRLALLGAVGLLIPACGIGGSGTLTPTAAPGIPTGLTAVMGNGSTTLSWNASPAAAAYVVSRASSKGGPYSPLPGGTGVHGTSFKDDTLTNGQSYYYVVGATNAFGQSLPSVEIRVVSGIFATQVAMGAGHTLALLSDGSLWGWGDNLSGQLGDGGTSTISAVAVPVPLTEVTAIAAGNRSSVALRKDGTVWTWGINTGGQLGNGTVNSGSATPVQAATPSGIVAIMSGYNVNLALRSDGTLWGWGDDSYSHLLTAGGGPVSTPLQIAGISDVKAASAGVNHVLALKTDGTVWAWGANFEGQLGDGTRTDRSVPKVVTNLTGITAVAAGFFHSLALASDGRVWAWGSCSTSTVGLGTGSPTGSTLPIVVPGLSTVEAVGAGISFSVALRAGGSLWSWGENLKGKLGNPGVGNSSTLPQQIPLIDRLESLSAGPNGAAAIQSGGLLWGWGDNTYGQLGNGSAGIVPHPVPSRDLESLSAISAGGAFGIGLRSDHTLWSWGSGTGGALGDGESTTVTGDRILVSAPPGLATPVAVSAGSGFILALNSNGTVWSWGDDDDYALGHATSIFNVPQQIPTLSGITGICAGNQNGFAIGSGGVVWGWGYNGKGNAGTGNSPNDIASPAILPGLSGITAVSAGGVAAMALGPGGAVWTWGDNSVGQLGIRTTTGQSDYAVSVPGLSGVVGIAAGTGFAVVVKSDGTVWVWGSNATGTLAGATTAPSSGTPLQVPGLSSIIAVAAGSDHALALKSDGTVWTWGGNSAGQLGNGLYTLFGGYGGLAQVQGLGDVIAISAGNQVSLALVSDHSMWGWGNNTAGQLATGTVGLSSVPVLITR